MDPAKHVVEVKNPDKFVYSIKMNNEVKLFDKKDDEHMLNQIMIS